MERKRVDKVVINKNKGRKNNSSHLGQSLRRTWIVREVEIKSSALIITVNIHQLFMVESF